jgi:hypothetical protein
VTDEELGLIACAIRYGRFPPMPQYLPACHHLAERGWLTRHVTDTEVSFSLSDRGIAALELGVPLGEARESMN